MSDPITSIYRSFQNVIEMLRYRGYDIPENTVPKTIQEFTDLYGSEAADIRTELYGKFIFQRGTKSCGLFWSYTMGTDDIQNISEEMKNAKEPIKHSIVIYKNKITSYCASALRHLRTQGIVIEAFSEAELQINIINHEDIPRHIICSVDKKNNVLSKYYITKDKLPQIRSTDPVARYLGAFKGQLLKIIRPSDSIPKVALQQRSGVKELFDITYRIVV